jgi:hypothetical protein
MGPAVVQLDVVTLECGASSRWWTYGGGNVLGWFRRWRGRCDSVVGTMVSSRLGGELSQPLFILFDEMSLEIYPILVDFFLSYQVVIACE